ncbi:60s ribosomal protein l34 [Anaeramoeba ignava]|uniref:60s ribosomal protein l34 n=1 Tax=Anaeramoeba ignava TaxID=1746090 RepID=A0A9Q0LBW1_ANAIG|nr:60s ribosomal protein l34 [Anaeramoeba ignava]
MKRLTYRRRHPYNTKSNRVKVVRTPGDRHIYHYVKKRVKGRRCGVTGVTLHGLPHLRTLESRRHPKRDKKVYRAYGGCLSANTVRDRIIRSFLKEEQTYIKKLITQEKKEEMKQIKEKKKVAKKQTKKTKKTNKKKAD